ncbi:MAG: phytanoyl-CoA dioxygenase family protein [Truepera sp.]|nr:phytanoyl-CoA dioxygenase family protein [Truepera sp.]
MAENAFGLPDLSTPYTLSPEQIEGFRRDGHIHLPTVCSPEEVAVYRKVITETAYAAFPDKGSLEERDSVGKAFLQTLNLRFKSDGVRAFVLAKRLAKIVADLTGVDGVRIYHEQALFKEPGGSITHWHQDQYYWPLATDKAVGLWMPLVDVSLDMGPIRYASGSHHEGFLGQYAISDTSQDIFDRVIRDQGFPIWQEPMKAGDALFHNAWILHGATSNRSSTMREAMIVTYYPDGTRVDELSNPNRENDARVYLGGRRAGELADSELNTVVYRREW